ncbi:MAG TPA: SURF1 family protein [Anaerolineaceae bacterium]|jgi:surfeit locus 1 family protein
MYKSLLPFRWILSGLLVLVLVGVMIRLGFWQLDRLAERRALNARINTQITAPVLNLNLELPVNQLFDMEYRSVVVSGFYDFSQEVILRNQVHDDKLGYAVITPLKIQGSSYSVMVERGWIPGEEAQPDLRVKFAEPGLVQVNGLLRRSQSQGTFMGATEPTLAPGQTRQDTWTMINLESMQQQVKLTLLPVYIQQAPDSAWTVMPYRSINLPDLSEGPHLGYAIQWFIFSTIVGVGYPIYVRRRLKKLKK